MARLGRPFGGFVCWFKHSVQQYPTVPGFLIRRCNFILLGAENSSVGTFIIDGWFKFMLAICIYVT